MGKGNVGLKIGLFVMLMVAVLSFEKFIHPLLFSTNDSKMFKVAIDWGSYSDNLSGHELYLNGEKIHTWRDWEQADLENTSPRNFTKKFSVSLPQTGVSFFSIVSVEMDGEKSKPSPQYYLATYKGKIISQGKVPANSQSNKKSDDLPIKSKEVSI